VTAEPELRVSAATLNRVLFPDLAGGQPLLALERKATLLFGRIFIRAQPFGGAVRIRDQAALRARVGEFRFDSPRSEEEHDLRIFIRPEKWPAMRRLCIEELGQAGAILDGSPTRELSEEFRDALDIDLRTDQYTIQPAGFAFNDTPVATSSGRSPGSPTARVYRIYKVNIIDPDLQQALLNSSRRLSDAALETAARADARRGGRGYANAALVLPLEMVTQHFQSLPAGRRGQATVLAGRTLDPVVAAVLEDPGESAQPGKR